MLHQNQYNLKPTFECGSQELFHSLTWLKPHERLFAAAISQHSNRMIRIYDPKGSPKLDLLDSTDRYLSFDFLKLQTRQWCRLPLELLTTFVPIQPNDIWPRPQTFVEQRHSVANLTVVDPRLENGLRLWHSFERTTSNHPRRTRTHRQTVLESSRVCSTFTAMNCWRYIAFVSIVWSSSQLGYSIRDSPKFHLLSVNQSSSNENESFVHRILQCKWKAKFVDIRLDQWFSFQVRFNDTESVCLRSTGIISTKIVLFFSVEKNTSTMSFQVDRALSNIETRLKEKIRLRFDISFRTTRSTTESSGPTDTKSPVHYLISHRRISRPRFYWTTIQAK